MSSMFLMQLLIHTISKVILTFFLTLPILVFTINMFMNSLNATLMKVTTLPYRHTLIPCGLTHALI